MGAYGFMEDSEVHSLVFGRVFNYYNRDLQRMFTGTFIILQETINGFLSAIIFFQKVNA